MNFRLSSLALLLVTSLVRAEEVPRQRDAERVALIRERAAESQKALAAARALAGYDEVKRSFRLVDAHLGLINSMPESLFIELRSIKGRTIDAARWWNPLSGETPTLSWTDFFKAYTAAERIVAKHPWFSALMRLPGKRSLEVQLLGMGIGAADGDLTTFLLPPWRHAGMAGQPAYCFLARRGNHSWVEFFFSDTDDRAFVRYAALNDPDPQSPLDSLDLSWHPRGERGDRYSQYALIAFDRGVRLHTYVLSEQ